MMSHGLASFVVQPRLDLGSKRFGTVNGLISDLKPQEDPLNLEFCACRFLNSRIETSELPPPNSIDALLQLEDCPKDTQKTPRRKRGHLT